MSNYLYQYPAGQTAQDNSAFVAELANGDSVYLLPHEIVGKTLVGEWDNDGQLISMDVDIYGELRPLGNEEITLYDDEGNVIGTKAGMATDALDLIHYQGHAQRHMQETPVVDTLPEYPADNQPFTLRITRTLTTDDAWPHIPWRWTVAMRSNDPLRDIVVRAIGIYDESNAYLGTTGSFVLMDFDDIDEEGNPIIVQRYGCECPAALWRAEAEIVYFKLLYSGQPEGAWQLTALEEGTTQERLFWTNDQ